MHIYNTIDALEGGLRNEIKISFELAAFEH